MQLLRILALILVVAGVTGVFIRAASGYSLLSMRGAAYPVLGVGLATLVLLQFGLMRVSAWVMFLGLLAAVVYGSSAFGLRAVVWVALPIITMTAGWLLGPRAALILLLASCVSVGLTYGQLIVEVSEQKVPDLIYAAGYCLVAAMGAAIGIFTKRTFSKQYDDLRELSLQLHQSNAELERRVAERTEDLSASLEKLKRTQDDLIQSEKLASLGGMVAGIAHELNTPIGNALITASTLQARARALDGSIQGGAIKKSELASGLGALAEMSDLIERSVQRASTLVASFKQVAIDQVSERRRDFDLRAVVEENLTALRPSLRNTPWQIENRVPEGIACDSFPGPLGQVLTNLIQNAIVHGFDDREHGTVTVEASSGGANINLTVSDDGIGMDTATSLHAFEPFFTTKLGRGGSGLGLAVCFRIVTTILGGEIRVLSTLGVGTRFTITLPRRTPGKI